MTSFLKKHQLIITSVLLCLLALHITSRTTKGVGGTTITARIVSAVTSPIQAGITFTVEEIGTIWISYIYLVGVNKENKILQTDIARLKEENNQLKETLLLNERLTGLLSFKQEIAAASNAANVIGIESAGWVRTITINKGASDGIRRDSAVITPLGIAGRIIEVQPNVSKALLVTDPRCAIDVIIQRNRVKGIVEGTGADRLSLKYVRHEDDIQIGDVLISSGLGGIFPKGMVVGFVVRVEKGDDNFFLSIDVKPGADLRKLEEVLVIPMNSEQ